MPRWLALSLVGGLLAAGDAHAQPATSTNGPVAPSIRALPLVRSVDAFPPNTQVITPSSDPQLRSNSGANPQPVIYGPAQKQFPVRQGYLPPVQYEISRAPTNAPVPPPAIPPTVATPQPQPSLQPQPLPPHAPPLPTAPVAPSIVAPPAQLAPVAQPAAPRPANSAVAAQPQPLAPSPPPAASSSTPVGTATQAFFQPADQRGAVGQPLAHEQLPGVPQLEVIRATGKLSFNFQDAPWDLVLKRFASEAGMSLRVETIPSGNFTYIDQREHTPTEAIDILNGSLLAGGHLLVRRSGTLTLIKTAEGLPISEIPLVPLHEIEQWGRNELISVDVPLATVDPIIAAQEVQPMLSPLGRAVPMPQTHRMIVTDLGSNLRRLHHLLWIGEADPSRQPHVVFHLKNIQAVDAAKAINEFLASQRQTGPMAPQRAAIVNQIVNQPGPGPAPPPAAVIPADSVVVAEATTNCVIVSATNRHLDRIRGLLHELDSIPVQVVIQALLVEVDLGKTEELGVELGGQDSVLFDRSVVDKLVTVTQTVSNPATGIATTNQNIVSQTAAPGFNFNNQPLGNNIAASPSTVGSQGLSNFAVGRVNGDLGYGGLVLSAGSSSVNVLLRALAATRKLDILSRPQIRTVDNRLAEIQIGQQVPVVDGVALTPVGSANPVIRQDQAGIILRVTPRVNPHGEVVIDVLAEKSEFRLGKGTGVPIFTDATNGNVIEAPIKDVSRAKATVSCPNGQTIVLGGMITKGTSVMERKVPFLGDLPLLGRLFRYDSETMARKELLIFLTPQVICSPNDSEQQKEVEVARTHFPIQDAMQLHSQQPGPPEPIQPPGPRFPRAERREMRVNQRAGAFVN
ncbi:MAG: hypothetical protein JNM18_11320 [Planctomycetaceae bacterium]|nr:hypothetical protein [Planctomycetaceae bacterium]